MSKGKWTKLTKKEENFCRFYLMYFNQSKAAKEAGYEDCNQSGWELMQKDKIKTEIERLQKLQNTAIQMEFEDIVREITNIALDPNTANREKLKALDLLCKIKGFFAPEKIEHEVKQVIFKEELFIDNSNAIEAEVMSNDYSLLPLSSNYTKVSDLVEQKEVRNE